MVTFGNGVSYVSVLQLTLSYLLLPIMLAGSMLGSFDTRDLAKIPNLVKHYHHHRIAHGQPELLFIDFIADHFHAAGEQDPEHEDLPILGGFSTASLVLPMVDWNITYMPLQSGSLTPIIDTDTNRPLNGQHLDVFQPPRCP